MKSILSLLVLWFLCQSCYFSPALRTGRTLDKGQQQAGLNINTFVIPDEDNSVEETAFIPIPEVYYAVGVSNKIDVIGKISLGSFHTEGRYQFLGDKTSSFAGSAGFGLSLSYFVLNFISTEENFLTLTPSIPLSFSYHHSEKFAFYVSPRYSVLSLIGNDSDGIPGIFSLAGGIEMGNQFVVNIEGGFQSFHAFKESPGSDPTEAAILPQFSLGLAYRFGGKR